MLENIQFSPKRTNNIQNVRRTCELTSIPVVKEGVGEIIKIEHSNHPNSYTLVLKTTFQRI